MNKQKLINLTKQIAAYIAQSAQRFARWWWATFRKQTGRGKAVFGCGSLLGACFLLTMCSALVAGPSSEATLTGADVTLAPLQLDDAAAANNSDDTEIAATAVPTDEPTSTAAPTNTPRPTHTATRIPPTETATRPPATSTPVPPTAAPTQPPATVTPIPPTAVPTQTPPPPTAVPPTQAAPTEPPPPPPPSNCVDINRASFDDLKRIKHIDDVRANDLIALRPFSSVDALTRIKGIGPARLADIKAEGLACVLP